MAFAITTKWQQLDVKSPHIARPVSVIAALNVPYVANGHRFQTVGIYIPYEKENEALIAQSAITLPATALRSKQPRIHVHIHGGAWRDPNLSSTSIEAAVAHAFTDVTRSIDAIISINYTLSPFPTHPSQPYDPEKDNHSDPSREAVHPKHVGDVIQAFALLKNQYGLSDNSYILTGHSAGACLAFQSTLKAPSWWKQTTVRPPTPAALVGLNGLYDLVELVSGLGTKHKSLRDVYENLIGIAFGEDQSKWPLASPARFDVDELSKRVAAGEAPKFVLLDQSVDDQLVPVNQRERLQLQLSLVEGMKVVQGHRATGIHAAPWEQGYMIWDTVKDVLAALKSEK